MRLKLCALASAFVGLQHNLNKPIFAEEKRSLDLDLDLLIQQTQDSSSSANKSPRAELQAKLDKAKNEAKSLIWSKMNESAIPGLVIAVSVDGKTLFRQGFGFADVENRVMASPSTVMRIASISKPLAMTAAAKLVQEGKLDLDKPIRDYVPSWPEKHAPITTRQIASHTAGIRHYKKAENDDSKDTDNGQGDGKYPEFYSNKPYKTIKDALEVFQNDDLLCEPGTEFNYTTHGFTLLSAVIEAVADEPFAKHIKKLFKELGLSNTYLDENKPIIPNRSRFYQRNKDHKLENCPAVDNSMKWAGGGFLSTVGDLLQFGNAMLYSFQFEDSDKKAKEVAYHLSPYHAINDSNSTSKVENGTKKSEKNKKLPPVLKKETMDLLWNPIIKTSKDSNFFWGLSWAVTEEKTSQAFAEKHRFYATHTGGAVGASSVLLIYPRKKENMMADNLPQGVVVAIICNMQSVGLSKLATDIAKIFETIPSQPILKKPKVEEC